MLGRPNFPTFASFAAASPQRAALVTADGATTYGELDDRVGSKAAELGRQRRLVAVGAANTVKSVVAYLAALRSRCPVLLVPDDDPVASARLIEAYDPDSEVTSRTGWEVDLRRREPAHDLHPDLALLLSTSGSTGSSKLVRLSSANLEANAASIASYLALTPDDRAVTTLPLQYCYGLSVLHSHLHRGASLALTSLSVVDPCLWDLFRSAEATSLAGVPHTFDLLDRVGFPTMHLPSLRYLTQAGGRMAPETVRRYAEHGRDRGWDLFVMYGQTEATARIAYLPPALATTHSHTIGVAIPGGQLSLAPLDGGDGSAGIGGDGSAGIGELVYRGPNVMLGYAERPADLALGATVDELRTGDLARRTPEGLFEVVGRRSRFLKLFGLRIDLDELERQLSAGGVAALCTGDDRRLVVAIEPGASAAALVDQAVASLGLPSSRIVLLEADPLPRLPNGKPDHAEVRRRAGAGTAGTVLLDARPDAAPPAGAEARDDLRQAYADALGLWPEDADTFVGLGGDSLSYVELSIALEDILGELPAQWHVTPVGELRPASRRNPVLARVDTSVALRAVAIVLVVTTHTNVFDLPGGAHTLLAVAGFNFARFQLRARRRLPAIARIAVPSGLWLAAVAALGSQFQWHHAVFLNAQLGGPATGWHYWFVEALLQILVPLTVVCAVPGFRALERRLPFTVPLVLTGAALLIRFNILDPPTAPQPTLRAHEIFWIFALGWLAARSTTTAQRLVVSGLVLASVPGFFDRPEREVFVLVGFFLLLWVPTVVVPRPLHRGVGVLAAASLAIYLTHWQVFPPLERDVGHVAAAAGSLVAGCLAWAALGRATEAVTGLVRGARAFLAGALAGPARPRSDGDRPGGADPSPERRVADVLGVG